MKIFKMKTLRDIVSEKTEMSLNQSCNPEIQRSSNIKYLIPHCSTETQLLWKAALNSIKVQPG
jgi:hypothetical protein